MSDEVKEILIDLVDYHCRMETKLDPDIGTLENIAKRASRALENYAKNSIAGKNSADIDPYGNIDDFPVYKLEDEW